ncbi:MAG: hypothetical protein CMF38_02840 [Legionellaceae bacterium]|nr:hypothetical protein [Legionellaceae bacterium]
MTYGTSWPKVTLITRYFLASDEKLKAWLLLFFGLLCTLVTTVTIILFPWLFALIWSALAGMNVMALLATTCYFGLAVACFVVFDALKTYVSGRLAMSWRCWLTKDILVHLNNTNDTNSDKVENIAQRVQEDVKIFVNSSINFCFNTLKYSAIFIFFMVNLWLIGSALSFTLLGCSIVIPGFLFWAAFLITLIGALVTHLIGKNFIHINQQEIDTEANLRAEINNSLIVSPNVFITSNVDINDKLGRVSEATHQKLCTQTKISIFKNFYMQIVYIIPYLLAAPFYLTGQFNMAKIVQIGASFGEINYASNWFISNYEAFVMWKTSLGRIAQISTSRRNQAANIREDAIKPLKAQPVELAEPIVFKPLFKLRENFEDNDVALGFRRRASI